MRAVIVTLSLNEIGMCLISAKFVSLGGQWMEKVLVIDNNFSRDINTSSLLFYPIFPQLCIQHLVSIIVWLIVPAIQVTVRRIF